MNPRAALFAGGALMLLLGLARGAGGVVLLLRGAAADPGIQARGSIVAVLGALLAVLGIGLVAAAVGVLRRSRRAWLWGLYLVLAFVADGALNGYVLYGRPGDAGTAVNALAAALILLGLVRGRAALDRRSSDGES